MRSAGSAAAKVERFAVAGMGQRQTCGVQELAAQTGRARAAAVLHVAGDRVPERREVHPDLMRAPCLQAHLHQREPFVAAQDA